jgi:hypothetical protein
VWSGTFSRAGAAFFVFMVCLAGLGLAGGVSVAWGEPLTDIPGCPDCADPEQGAKVVDFYEEYTQQARGPYEWPVVDWTDSADAIPETTAGDAVAAEVAETGVDAGLPLEASGIGTGAGVALGIETGILGLGPSPQQICRRGPCLARSGGPREADTESQTTGWGGDTARSWPSTGGAALTRTTLERRWRRRLG